MDGPNPVYTLGYGNRSIEDFLSLLQRYEIEVVCDVRSAPYSSRFPDFSREVLQAALKGCGLRYLFMGELLGARPSDPDCYENGRVSYDLLSKSSAFRQGIERVETGAETLRIALMCAEKDPLDCHRAVLISRWLSHSGISILHIDATGDIETHSQFEARLLKRFKLDQASLFDLRSNEEALNEAYIRRGHDLAFDAAAVYSA